MDDHSTDSFGPMEEDNDDNVEQEEKPAEGQEKKRLLPAPKRKEKLRTILPD